MAAAPDERCIALGASNLARLALPLLDAMRAATGGPVALHAALGRGRSYVVRSRLLGRGLGSIDHSDLWATLAAAPRRPGFGLVMDVGNDLLYGLDVPRIVERVDAALARLRPHTDRRAVVGLPLAALRTLSVARFTLVRSVLVPSCRLTLPQALAAAERLHGELAALAARHDAAFHELPRRWYAFDPIHVRRSCHDEAVRTWCGAGDRPVPPPPAAGALARFGFLFAAPAERTWFGRRTQTAQPVRRLGDGSTVSLW